MGKEVGEKRKLQETRQDSQQVKGGQSLPIHDNLDSDSSDLTSFIDDSSDISDYLKGEQSRKNSKLQSSLKTLERIWRELLDEDYERYVKTLTAPYVERDEEERWKSLKVSLQFLNKSAQL